MSLLPRIFSIASKKIPTNSSCIVLRFTYANDAAFQPRHTEESSSISQRRFSTFPLPDHERLEDYEKKCSNDPGHFKVKGRGGLQVLKTQEVIDKAMVKNDDHHHDDFSLPHPVWSESEANEVVITHEKPRSFCDWSAYFTVHCMRKGFDLLSGYTIKRRIGTLDERDVLRRCIFLETVAGVPGFAAAMIRHLQSLRRMQRDNGWIHTLLEEAENERMHLMTFLQLRNPGPILRTSVALTQIVFTAMFCLAYFISPHFCHRFVGYLEEQAVITYTHILEEMEEGRLPMWAALPAPSIAVRYWQLPPMASMRDVILVIRADEAHHRLVNHTLGGMDLRKTNPFKPGE